MVGASLSFCIRDLAERREIRIITGFEASRGFYRPVYEKRRAEPRRLRKIIAATAAQGQTAWRSMVEQYCTTYWYDNPQRYRALAASLRQEGMIEQPRLQGKEPHSICWGYWYMNERLFQVSQELINKSVRDVPVKCPCCGQQVAAVWNNRVELVTAYHQYPPSRAGGATLLCAGSAVVVETVEHY